MLIVGKYTTAEIFTDNIEEQCIKQVVEIVNNENYNNPIKIMPDTHAGKGAVIGFTMELDKTLNPEIIGVDIGCGVDTYRIVGKSLTEDDLVKVNTEIRHLIPMGFNVKNKGSSRDVECIFRTCQKQATDLCMVIQRKYGVNIAKYMPIYNSKWVDNLIDRIGANHKRIYRSIGTLGGGNHFIELGVAHGDYFLTFHSGSRNLGNRICEYYTKNEPLKELANRSYLGELEFLKEATIDKTKLPKLLKELSTKYKTFGSDKYLSGEFKARYLFDMIFAQNYATLNRETMFKTVFDKVFKPMGYKIKESYNCTHNYIDFRDMIIRKGAISAKEGEICVIPFNMRDGILVGVGKGNLDWNQSAPHGAGRIMSRTTAKAVLNIEDAKKQMAGIYTTEIPLDEAPDAYKDCKEIELAIEDTVDIKFKIKPILNIKSK